MKLMTSTVSSTSLHTFLASWPIVSELSLTNSCSVRTLSLKVLLETTLSHLLLNRLGLAGLGCLGLVDGELVLDHVGGGTSSRRAATGRGGGDLHGHVVSERS